MFGVVVRSGDIIMVIMIMTLKRTAGSGGLNKKRSMMVMRNDTVSQDHRETEEKE